MKKEFPKTCKICNGGGKITRGMCRRCYARERYRHSFPVKEVLFQEKQSDGIEEYHSCKWCNQTLPMTEFYLKKGTSECRKCRREQKNPATKRARINSKTPEKEEQKEKNIKSYHKINMDEYNLFITKSNHKCEICNCSVEKISRDRRKSAYLCRNPSSRKIAGILCHRCSLGLSLFKWDIKRMSKAVVYLSSLASE